jgi:hypothetical protein
MDPGSQKGMNAIYASRSPAAYTSSAIPKLRLSTSLRAPSCSALRHNPLASCFLAHHPVKLSIILQHIVACLCGHMMLEGLHLLNIQRTTSILKAVLEDTG